MSEYTVGQRVWVYSYRRGEPQEGTVTKVGRKLVTVRTSRFTEWQYRMDTGRINDDFGHSWIKTDEQRALDGRRTAAWDRIKATRTLDAPLGGGRSLSVDSLERIAEIVETDA